MTLAEHVHAAARMLAFAGIEPDDARRDATVLARAVLGWDAATWLTRQRDPAPLDFATRFGGMISRRGAREPVAYITGVREFYGRDFAVTRDVLIPRPETEFLVEETLTLLRGSAVSPRSPLVVDVGTGSGCLAITLALEHGGARVVATDTSAAALGVAHANAARLGATEIEFRLGSLLAEVPAPIDVIVSNPPYVPERDRHALAPEVAAFEPASALFGGADGLDVIRALATAAATALAPGGALVLEIGEGQEAEVRGILARSGLATERMRADLQGIPRVVVAARR